MKTIRVGFSSHKTGITSWLIRKIERTPYSHVYIRFHSNSIDRDLIYQASGLAVNFMGPEIFSDKNNVYEEFVLHVPDDVYLRVVQFAVDNAGKPYGLKGLFGFIYIKFMALFGKRVHNPFADGMNTYVCSELISTILEHFLSINIGDHLDDVSPKDLYRYMKRID